MTEQSPLERAARALCKQAGGNPDGTSYLEGKPCWSYFQNNARAALTAIREPSKAMIDAGFVARDMERSPIAIWQAMLDAALNQQGE